MPHASPADVVNEQLRAYNAGDIVAFAATYSENVCTYDMPHAKALIQGKEALVERYGNTTFKREGLRAEILSRVVIGNKVIDHEKTWGIQAEPVECAVVYEVHEGRITAVWFYEIEGASKVPSEAEPLVRADPLRQAL